MTGIRTARSVPITTRSAPNWADGALAVAAATLCVLVLLTANPASLDPGLGRPTVGYAVLTAAGALGVGLRRRAPLSGLVIVAAMATAVSAGGHWTGLLPYLTLFALYSVAAHGTRRRELAGLAVVVACFSGLAGLGVPDLTLGDLATNVAVAVAATAVGDAMRVRRAHQAGLIARATAEAERATAEAERATAEAARAVAEERLRIARELHDVVAHSMSLIAVQAGVGSHLLGSDPAAAGRALDVIAGTSRDALAQARSVIGLLRSGADAQPSLPGLAALDVLVQGVRDTGLPVELHRDDATAGDVPAAVDLAAYRIVQEALTNAVRHAPGRPVTVRVRHAQGELRIEIEDDAPSGPPPGPAELPAGPRTRAGFGLVGLHERASALGGRLTAGRTDAGTFRVSARLPLRPAGAAS